MKRGMKRSSKLSAKYIIDLQGVPETSSANCTSPLLQARSYWMVTQKCSHHTHCLISAVLWDWDWPRCHQVSPSCCLQGAQMHPKGENAKANRTPQQREGERWCWEGAGGWGMACCQEGAGGEGSDLARLSAAQQIISMAEREGIGEWQPSQGVNASQMALTTWSPLRNRGMQCREEGS